MTIWECALRDCPEEALQQLSTLIRSDVAAAEIWSEVAQRDSME